MKTPTKRKSRSKWRCSQVQITNVAEALHSARIHGGVWNRFIGRFMNKSWVLSQQIRYLDGIIARGALWFPEYIG